MKLTSSRRLGMLAAGGLLAAVLPAVTAPAQAATNLAYSCVIGGNPAATVSTYTDTDAPQAVPPGATFAPKLTTALTLDTTFVNNLRSNKVTHVSGTATYNLTVNNVAKQVSVTLVKKAVPASGSMQVFGSGTLAPITAPSDGAIVIRNGASNAVNLIFTPFEFAPQSGTCTKPAGEDVVDSVTVSKDAPPPAVAKVKTTTSFTKAWAKKKKKLIVAAVVRPASGATPTGTVKVVVYKNGKLIRSATKTLSRGKAAAVFNGIKKGSYRVVTVYNGSAKSTASVASKSFKLK